MPTPMPSPFVSIIIPCFNGRDCVGDAIQSAVDQTYANKEVIVIDDGSTDDSLAVIQGFGDKIRWETGPNRGGAAARNRGLSLARGEFIQFLDADDVLDPRKLEEQVPVLQAGGADVIYSDWIQYHADRPSQKWLCSVPHPSGDSVILALARQNITTEAPVHRKGILTGIGGFRADLPCCQERDLHLRQACHGARFRHLPRVLHTVRLRRGSVSDDEQRVIGWMRTLLSERYAELQGRGDLTEARKVAFATLMAAQGRVLLRYGDRPKAMEYFADARRMHPGGGLPGAYGRLGSWLTRLLGLPATESLLGQVRKMKAGVKSAFSRTA